MRRALAIILIATLLAPPAAAEGLEVLPKWHMTGSEACYDFEGAKKLVLLDTKLQLCLKTDEKVAKLEDLVKAQAEELTASRATARAQDQRAALLQSQVEDLNQRVIPLPWLLGGGAVLLVTGFVLGVLGSR